MPRFPFHDEIRLPKRAGDACVRTRKRSVVKRFLPLFALLACCTFASCKDVPAAQTATESSFIRPAKNIVIKNIRTFATGDAVAGNNAYEYYVVKFTFTNDFNYAFAPAINHFVFEDIDRRRFEGQDSGSTALVGINNYNDVLKPGDSHDYTVGFDVPQNSVGELLYDPTVE